MSLVKRGADSGKVTSQAKAAILAAFTIADELLRLKKEHADFSKRIDSLLEMAKQVQPASLQAE